MGVFTMHRESGCPKKPRGNVKFNPCGCRGSKHCELTLPALRHFMLFTLPPHPTDCTIYLASLIQMETMARINSAWSNIYPYQAQRKVCYFPFCPLFLASIPVVPPSCGVVFVDSGERGAGQASVASCFPTVLTPLLPASGSLFSSISGEEDPICPLIISNVLTKQGRL